MLKYVDAREFANASEADRRDAVVAKAYDADVKFAEGDGADTRTVTFAVSSDSVDRDGDIVFQDGMDWKSFQKNPVILWAHNSRELPVAKGSNVRRDGSKTLVDMTFAKADENPKADQVLKLIKGGFLKTVSIGFIPLELRMVEDKSTGRFGYDINKSEILEISVVPVPSNRDALVQGAKSGLDTSLVKGEIKTILKAYRLTDKDEVEAIDPDPAVAADAAKAFDDLSKAAQRAEAVLNRLSELPDSATLAERIADALKAYDAKTTARQTAKEKAPEPTLAERIKAGVKDLLGLAKDAKPEDKAGITPEFEQKLLAVVEEAVTPPAEPTEEEKAAAIARAKAVAVKARQAVDA